MKGGERKGKTTTLQHDAEAPRTEFYKGEKIGTGNE